MLIKSLFKRLKLYTQMLTLKGPYKPIETGAMKADYDVHPKSHIGLDYLGLDNNKEV